MSRLEPAERTFLEILLFSSNFLPILVFVNLDGEFTDGDRMLSERGIQILPSLVMIVAIIGVIIFLFSMASLAAKIRAFGVTVGNLIRALVVFTITTPSAFALVYIANENPADESKQCILNFAEHYDALYFSYSALTTLVHGNLEPIGFCRVLTSIEALLGYLFLGVLAAMFYRMMVPIEVE